VPPFCWKPKLGFQLCVHAAKPRRRKPPTFSRGRAGFSRLEKLRSPISFHAGFSPRALYSESLLETCVQRWVKTTAKRLRCVYPLSATRSNPLPERSPSPASAACEIRPESCRSRARRCVFRSGGHNLTSPLRKKHGACRASQERTSCVPPGDCSVDV
jgi:hypothetical protein